MKDDEVVASGFDLAGRPHIAGNFTGQAKFGGVELTSRLSGAFGAVLDANGDGVAAQRPKGWGLSRARAGAVDGNGNLYVLGMSAPRDSHCGFDDPHMPCLGDLYLAKFEPDGTPSWSTRTSGDAQARARALTVDAAGNVHIAGAFSGARHRWARPPQPRGKTPTSAASSE